MLSRVSGDCSSRMAKKWKKNDCISCKRRFLCDEKMAGSVCFILCDVKLVGFSLWECQK